MDRRDEIGELAQAFNELAVAQRRLNRALRLLSDCSQALNQADRDGPILQEICRLIVDTGGYPLAWVSYSPEKESLEAVAMAGAEGSLEVAVAGYPSRITLPLKNQEGTFGWLGICAQEPDAFHSDELKLLEELAGNLAFGIPGFRARHERQRVEREIHVLNQELEQRVVD